MKAAFYKGTRPGWQGLYSILVRFVDGRGKYSHCELVFSDGLSGSASYIDGGVRFKAIDYSQHPEHWDFLDLPDAAEPYARDWFERNAGAPYDLLGNVRFVLPWVRDSETGWFCSEAMAAALRLQEPWRYGPNGLAALMAGAGATAFFGASVSQNDLHSEPNNGLTCAQAHEGGCNGGK